MKHLWDSTQHYEDKPVGYDGYGAPIYPHQLEDTMPTDLPEDFKGTNPEPTGEPDAAPWWAWILALFCLSSGLYIAVHGLLYLYHLAF